MIKLRFLTLATVAGALAALPAHAQQQGQQDQQGQRSQSQPMGQGQGQDSQARQGQNGQAQQQQDSQQTQLSELEIRQMQHQLKQLGFYDGQVDGIVGPQTRQAVNEFQRQHNRQQTTSLDRQTVDDILSGASSATGGSTGTGERSSQSPARSNGDMGTPGQTRN